MTAHSSILQTLAKYPASNFSVSYAPRANGESTPWGGTLRWDSGTGHGDQLVANTSGKVSYEEMCLDLMNQVHKTTQFPCEK